VCCCWQDVNVETRAMELFDKHVSSLSSATCDQIVLQTVGKIDIMFHNSLKPKVVNGETRAVCTANTTVDKWGSKVTYTALSAVFY